MTWRRVRRVRRVYMEFLGTPLWAILSSTSTNISPHEFRGGALKARPALLPARCSSYLLLAPERHPVENFARGHYRAHGLARLLTRKA